MPFFFLTVCFGLHSLCVVFSWNKLEQGLHWYTLVRFGTYFLIALYLIVSHGNPTVQQRAAEVESHTCLINFVAYHLKAAGHFTAAYFLLCWETWKPTFNSTPTMFSIYEARFLQQIEWHPGFPGLTSLKISVHSCCGSFCSSCDCALLFVCIIISYNCSLFTLSSPKKLLWLLCSR